MYHQADNTAEKSLEPAAINPLFIFPKQKKPAAIAHWQAYSQLYFKKGTDLYAEIHIDYEALKANSKAAHRKYSHLFPDLDCESLSTINWLSFYQAVMMDRVKNIGEVELRAVKEHIDSRYQRELNIYERLWDVYLGKSVETKKRGYLAQ